MAYAYRIPYEDQFGRHEAAKWGESPADAVSLLKAALVNRGCMVVEVGEPIFVRPQPFGDFEPPAAAPQPATQAESEGSSLVLI